MGTDIDQDEKISLKGSRDVASQLFKLLGPSKKKLPVIFLVLILSTIATLSGPALIAYGIDHGIQRKNYRVLETTSIMFIVSIILAIVLSRIQIKLMASTGEKLLRDLRIKLFRHLSKLSLSFYDSQPTGKLVARMTSDFDAMEDLVQQGLVIFTTNALLFLVALIVLAVMSLPLFLISISTLPPLILLSIWFQKRSKFAYLAVRDRIGKTLTTLQEGISGVKVIQAFVREEALVKSFRKQNEAQLSANLKAIVISIKYFPVLEATGVISTALILGVGGVFVHHHVVAFGVVVAFILYLNSLYDPIQQMSQLFSQIQSTGAALSKVFDILNTKIDVPIRANAVSIGKSYDVELNNVSFSYKPSLPAALEKIQLLVPEGESIALVGPTGAGKSTLAKLIARFHDPSEGFISIGGIDLKDIQESSLRQALVVVPQEGFLFAGNVKDNVRLAKPDASDSEVISALEKIGVLDRFLALENGLETELFERGSQLSAGERQLISLARAALLDPKILILDEATSNLDPHLESKVEIAVESLSMGRTTIIIAHRLSTAMRQDKIAVIDNARLVELGSHDELIKKNGRYSLLFNSWQRNVA